ncbi:MAG: SAM-dependent methyltransferase [Microthrixaceae bacterium]
MAAAGPMRFDRLWDLALYDPEVGFYETGGSAGRRGDFITSVELGPLFGACLARRLDASWDAADRPERWQLVDVGAGPGTLARAVISAQPRCLGALEVVLVERSAAQRVGHHGVIEWAAERGVRVASRPDLPSGVRGLIVAHELLDNLPVRVVQRHLDVVVELWAEADESADPPATHAVRPGAGARNEVAVSLSWRPVPAADAVELAAAPWWPAVPVGRPVPWARAAAAWVAHALAALEDGSLLVVDYGAPGTAALADREGWLRTYADGAVGTDPTQSLGSRDITADVPFDQLGSFARLSSQADALAAWGIDELVAAARARLADRPPGTMDLQWARDTSVLNEAPSLVDPAGLGGFLMAEWDTDG